MDHIHHITYSTHAQTFYRSHVSFSKTPHTMSHTVHECHMEDSWQVPCTKHTTHCICQTTHTHNHPTHTIHPMFTCTHHVQHTCTPHNPPPAHTTLQDSQVLAPPRLPQQTEPRRQEQPHCCTHKRLLRHKGAVRVTSHILCATAAPAAPHCAPWDTPQDMWTVTLS
jgi:hypothetical protein